MAIWAHQDAPDNKGPTVGYHVPKTGQVNYPRTAAISLLIHETLRSETLVNGETFMLRPVSSLNQVGSFIAGRLVYSFNDVLTFTPTVPLAADTTYEVYLPESGVKDAVGNGISAYRYRFSTGSTVVGDVGNSPGDGLVSPPNENSPQPDPEENPDFQTLNLEIKTNSKTSLTQKVSFIMPKTILSQLTKAGSKKAKRATVQVLINGSIVHSEKVFKIKRINLNLKKRKVALASTLGTGQNTLVVKVFIGNSQLGEGSDQV